MSEVKKFLMGAVAAIGLFGLLVLAGPALSPVSVNAQKIVQPCVNCPIIGNPSNIKASSEGIAGLILRVARWVTYILGAVAVLFLVYGGFLFVTDVGDGNRAGQGKKIFQSAVLGLILAIAAFAIVAVIGNLLQGNLLQVVDQAP
jgi:hypothetical protein